jgi:hypothetical protein
MAVNTLSPASVDIAYHTAFASHHMTIPTRAWNPVPVSGDLGSFDDWIGGNRDGQLMVEQLCGLLAVIVPVATVYDSVTVYTMATATSARIPRKQLALGIPGTITPAGFYQAQSATFNFKTTENGDFKLVLLDQPYGANGFNAEHPADFGAAITNLATAIQADTNGWAGRDDTQVASLRKLTFDLNEKLQKEYRMSA